MMSRLKTYKPNNKCALFFFFFINYNPNTHSNLTTWIVFNKKSLQITKC